MPVQLKGRSLLTLLDFTPEEIRYLLDLAHDLKRKKRAGIPGDLLRGRNVVLIFEKTSTRTRCAFETACWDEGGNATFLSNSQMGKKESLEDTARVLGRFYDGIEFRGFAQQTAVDLARFSGVPVWNGLTDTYHPTQILADFLTIQENFGHLKGIRLVYCGDGRNNMANSLMIGSAKMGIHFVIAAPKSLWPESGLVETCQAIARETGATIQFMEDALEAVKGADAIYTDVWASMGEEDKMAERVALLSPYQVNSKLMAATGKESTIFLHCLPAVKGKEVTEEVFESKNSKVFDEAENRLHTIKAVMVATLAN